MTFPDNMRIAIVDKYSPVKLLLLSLVIGIFIIYPNTTFYTYERSHLEESKLTAHTVFFAFRYVYFSLVIWALILYNLKRINTAVFQKRLLQTFILTLIAYAVYAFVTNRYSPKPDWFSGLLFLQFFIILILGTLIGHVSLLYVEQRRKELEIEHLKTENLQSRYDALTNQINPHFFFNSLNGLTSLIRKKNDEKTLAYVDKLSDVFRYILQSERKGLVTLEEELEFVQALRYMMEVRFANKLMFDIQVDKGALYLKIPVLSLLPLIDNVVVHNTIDSEHKMKVSIFMNDQKELVVSCPLAPKLSPPDTNGTGLRNLDNRFTLLINEHIRFDNDGSVFKVYLPLKQT